MKKTLFKSMLGALLALPIICSATTGDEFIGRWVNVKYASKRIEVEKDDNKFLVTAFRQKASHKYLSKLDDGNLVLDSGRIPLTLGIVKKTGYLLFAGEEYRRLKDGESFEYKEPAIPRF